MQLCQVINLLDLLIYLLFILYLVKFNFRFVFRPSLPAINSRSGLGSDSFELFPANHQCVNCSVVLRGNFKSLFTDISSSMYKFNCSGTWVILSAEIILLRCAHTVIVYGSMQFGFVNVGITKICAQLNSIINDNGPLNVAHVVQ